MLFVGGSNVLISVLKAGRLTGGGGGWLVVWNLGLV